MKPRALAVSSREPVMPAPKYIEIDGKRILWRDLVQKRRQQKAAYAKAEQPALFELKDDRRLVADRSAAGRYLAPSLFNLLDREC